MEYAAVVLALEGLTPQDAEKELAKALKAHMEAGDLPEFAQERLLGKAAHRNLGAHHYLLDVCVQQMNEVPELVCEELNAPNNKRALSVRVQGLLTAVRDSLADKGLL